MGTLEAWLSDGDAAGGLLCIELVLDALIGEGVGAGLGDGEGEL